VQVHIPCPNDRQWILIVANFIDKSFDVLNPHSSIEKFGSIISTVIFNFKQLFIACYPGCLHFNIRDFSVKHVHVPKYNFRYKQPDTKRKLLISSNFNFFFLSMNFNSFVDTICFNIFFLCVQIRFRHFCNSVHKMVQWD
jgi:hypothetical protein